MAKLKGGRRKAEGFRCYINFFPKQENRGLKRAGVITHVGKEGKPCAQDHFDLHDEISAKICKRLIRFEKEK